MPHEQRQKCPGMKRERVSLNVPEIARRQLFLVHDEIDDPLRPIRFGVLERD